MKQAGFEIVSLTDYIIHPTENQIAITFDDGYESFYTNVLPILQESKTPAAVFVPAGYIGKKADWDYLRFFSSSRHMTGGQIAECTRSGIEIGSHGYSHADMTGFSERLIRIELEKSKEILEDICGSRIKYISYPFGRYNDFLENLAADVGYEHGFSLARLKKSRYGFTLPRFAVYSVDTLFSVMCKVEKGLLQDIEKVKGAIINTYAFGTILLNRFRFRNIDAAD